MPIGVEDMIDTADTPTAYNSNLFVGHRPAMAAAVIATLRGR